MVDSWSMLTWTLYFLTFKARDQPKHGEMA
jgi:hypothetical protein